MKFCDEIVFRQTSRLFHSITLILAHTALEHINDYNTNFFPGIMLKKGGDAQINALVH